MRCKQCRHLAYMNTRAYVAEASRRHYLANKERHDQLSLTYYYANKSARAAKMAAWYKKNQKVVALNTLAYRHAHPGFVATQRAKRRSREIQATPAWADLDAIAAIYRQAADLTKSTGISHHVDHIIPLQGRHVCGLHVEGNLQILPWHHNIAKSNKFVPIASIPLTKIRQRHHLRKR